MKDINYKITIIIPIYNVEKYLNATIESVVNQTYKNLEIILVDDGSPDSCPKICDEWAEKDSRIKVLHKKNGGVSSARNAGLDIATGDYIAFVDGDDYIDPDMYEVMLSHIIQYDADAASCGMIRENENAPDEEWGSADAEIEIVDNIELLKRVGQASGILPVHVGNKLFSKNSIGNIRFDTHFKYAEDVLFNYYVSKNINKMVSQNAARYHYINNNSSASHKTFDAQRFDEHKVMDIIFEDAKGNKEIFNYCIQGDVLKSFRTIKEMMVSNNETDKFNEIRNRIVSNRIVIFKSGIFSKATKFKTIFCGFFQIYIKNSLQFTVKNIHKGVILCNH